MTDDTPPDDDLEMMPIKIEPNRQELMAQALQHGTDQAIMATRQNEEAEILAALEDQDVDPALASIHLHNWAPVIGSHLKIGDGWYCTVRCECGQEILEVADDAYRG